MGAPRAGAFGRDITFCVRLTPKGGRDAVDGWGHDANGAPVLRARVAAPAVHGKANAALVSLLARAFAVSGSAVKISAGAAARTKRIRIEGEKEMLSARLNQLGETK
jgi:hypothetical protein